MVEQICNEDTADLCKRILSVVAIVRRPVALKEVSSLIERFEPLSDDLESWQEIMGLCLSL
jgi:hypothetical protein